MSERPPPGRLTYLGLTCGVALFTIYGSYVPFEFRHRPWAEVLSAFRWAMSERFWPDSRSDWAANFALGFPLSFFALGWLRLDSPSRTRTLLVGLGLMPACAGWAMAIEFGQLYSKGRTCAGSDVFAQVCGALAGVLVWTAVGPWLTRQLRGMLGQSSLSAGPARWLALYLLLLSGAQWLPLDLSASPADLARRWQRGDIVVQPFADWSGHPAEWGRQLENSATLILLACPVGLLAAGLPGRWSRWDGWARVLAGSAGLAVVLELGQWMVMSRHPRSADVLMLILGTMLGWLAGRTCSGSRARKFRLEWSLAWAQVWFALMVIVHWQPFDFRPDMVSSQWSRASWLPLYDQAAKNYLLALNEVLTKFLLYVPLGAAVVWAGLRPESRVGVLRAAAIGVLAAAVFELGQLSLPSRFSSPTDVLFGLAGAALGGEATLRLWRQRLRIEMAEQPLPWWTHSPLASPPTARRAT